MQLLLCALFETHALSCRMTDRKVMHNRLATVLSAFEVEIRKLAHAKSLQTQSCCVPAALACVPDSRTEGENPQLENN